MPESPLIDFRLHETRAGRAGAPGEFEEMVNQLVHVLHPGSRSVQADPGDWGIDAFAGDLHGTITVWQSKYFTQIGKAQFNQINDSLNSVVKHAAKHGFRFERWILCTPCDLNPESTRSWQRLEQRYLDEHGVTLEFWGRTALTERLRRPEAWHLRYSYYGGNPPPRIPLPKPLTPLSPPDRTLSDPWNPGDVVRIRDQRYVVRRVATSEDAGGFILGWRTALAIPEGRSHLVWVQQTRGVGAASLKCSVNARGLPPVELYVEGPRQAL